ncbi:MAG: hypothetical protein ACTSRG_09145 [Candidatus Helarchaeota archaeon]
MNVDYIDRKKFIIHILFAIALSLIIQFFIYPLVINYISRFQGTSTAQGQVYITSISCWCFAFSLAFLIYTDNEIINSILFCSIIPLLIIVIREFLNLFFFDLLHIPPIIVIVYIILRLRKTDTINVKCVTLASPILAI